MNLKKALMILGIAVAALAIQLYSCRSEKPVSRKVEALSVADVPSEAAFAVDAVKKSNSRPAEFHNMWLTHGELYESAARTLKKLKMKAPAAVAAEKRGGDPRYTVITVQAGDSTASVTVFRNNENKLYITDIYVAEE